MLYEVITDIDNDGDQDLFVGAYSDYQTRIKYYQNIGTNAVPLFDAPVDNPFGLSPFSFYLAFPEMADLDNDGDIDLLIGSAADTSQYGDFYYFENTGTSENPHFANPQRNNFV